MSTPSLDADRSSRDYQSAFRYGFHGGLTSASLSGLKPRNSTLSRPIYRRMRFMSDDVDEMEASASSWDRRPLDY
jgi:hypothetical protein